MDYLQRGQCFVEIMQEMQPLHWHHVFNGSRIVTNNARSRISFLMPNADMVCQVPISVGVLSSEVGSLEEGLLFFGVCGDNRNPCSRIVFLIPAHSLIPGTWVLVASMSNERGNAIAGDGGSVRFFRVKKIVSR